jgi:uncharacterized membrane protein YeiB
MDAEEVGMLSGFGFVMQFLRGFSWFGDGLTVIAAVALGALMAYTRHGPNLIAVGVQTVVHFLEVMGGLSVGHLASRNTKLVPKFNAYSQEPDDGQAVSD